MFYCLKLSDAVSIMLINVKMPKMVGILRFMSMTNLLNWAEYEKTLFTVGPGLFFYSK